MVPPGVVFVPFHYGELGAKHSPNNLMPNQRDPVSMQPVQKYAAVRVERIDADGEDKWW